jgi:hypothetical protein
MVDLYDGQANHSVAKEGGDARENGGIGGGQGLKRACVRGYGELGSGQLLIPDLAIRFERARRHQRRVEP